MTDQTVLEQAIVTYNEAYRNGNPLITDAEYDSFVDKLKENFPNSKLLKKGVINQPKESRKQALPMPMYSLNKVKNNDEITKWMESKDLPINTLLIITPKYDGISLVINEKTKECWTRGDGEVGQVSTKHFTKLNRDVEDIECFFSCGEAIMSRKNWIDNFEGKINPETGNFYTNPRNTVAGWFNRDTPCDELKFVDYIRYGMSMNEDKNYQLNILNTLNRVPVQSYSCRFYDLTKELLQQLYQEWLVNYQIDGLVIDVDDESIRKRLGREENMNPAYSIAYKNPEWSSSAEVKVIGIEWKVSKQGKLKPVIQIEPTEVGGVTISNVTGYNAKYIFDNNICEDSIIKIIRSGDVIPKHIETISWKRTQTERLADEITACPCCDHPIKWDETFTELICTNPDCKDKKIAKLVHFFNTLEVEDFGEPSIIKFYDSGFKTPFSILFLGYVNIADQIEGFGEVSAKNLCRQFDKLKLVGVPFARLLSALDIMEGKLGEKLIQNIIDNTSNLSVLKFEDLIKINGISDITANIFIKGMNEYFNHQSVLEYIRIQYVITPKQEVIGNKYRGVKICFTGCRPSKEQQKEIESQGGEIFDGISNKTNLLVVKNYEEKTMKSSKALKAIEMNIKIIRIEEL
jgi:NAD-dependent DNA ligase